MRHISPRPEDVVPAPSAAPLSMTEIQAHYRRGRELQAQAIGAFFSRIFGRDADAHARREDRAVAAPSIMQALARSLTTVRTTSELLRDHPEIGPRGPQRQRLVGALEDERARLERRFPKAKGEVAPAE